MLTYFELSRFIEQPRPAVDLVQARPTLDVVDSVLVQAVPAGDAISAVTELPLGTRRGRPKKVCYILSFSMRSMFV